MTCGKYLAPMLAILTLATPVSAAEIDELANRFADAEAPGQRLEILRQMEAEVRAGNFQSMNSGRIARLAMNLDVVSASESRSLLGALLASPLGREGTVLAIGARLGDSRVDTDTVRTWIEMLGEYDGRFGLPDSVFPQLGDALGRIPDSTFRRRAFAFVASSSWARANRDELLAVIARFLEPRFPPEDRLWALGLLRDAAAAGAPLESVRGKIFRIATQDEIARLRVSAWPMLIAATSERDMKHLQMTLVREIQGPGRAISLYTAEPQAREEGVPIIAEMWKPGLPDLVIDGLIELVGATESAAALRELTEVRRVDGLDEQRLARLRALTLSNPESNALLETLLIGELQPGSLIGPIEAIEYSKSPEIRKLAIEQLLRTYPEGAVPVSVAEAAYRVLRDGGEAGNLAIDLVVRAEEPFATRAQRILELAGHAPRKPIIDALSQLHDGAGIEFLVQRYATDTTIAETFRSSLVSMLIDETANGGELRPETLQVLRELGESAGHYYTIASVIRVLESAGDTVPWSIRIRSSGFQWDLLFLSLLLSWIIAVVGSILWLLLIALPSRLDETTRGSRVGSFLAWLVTAVVFVASTGAAILFSLGHSEAPKPGPAVPFYVLTLFLACIIAAIGIGMWLRRTRARREAAAI